MKTIVNVNTQDTYAPALTLEDDQADLLAFTVANASAIARFRAHRRQSGGDQSYGPECLITPQSQPVPNTSGVKFRSAVAGTPAAIVATLVGPDDPQLGAGIPFAGTLNASGQVTVATPSQALAQATATLVLTAAMQDVPGCSINFTIVGKDASLAAVAIIDAEPTVAGYGLILAQINLDGLDISLAAVAALAAGERATIATQHLISPIAVGAHTIKLRAQKTIAGGAASVDTQTSLLLTILDR